jgi:hypothetical protein
MSKNYLYFTRKRGNSGPTAILLPRLFPPRKKGTLQLDSRIEIIFFKSLKKMKYIKNNLFFASNGESYNRE